jgi:hypothetical protein
MLITMERLKNLVAEGFRTRVIDMSSKKADDYDKMQGSISKGQKAQESATDDEIEGLRTMPEFEDVDSFMEQKLEDDDYSYTWVELQALARNRAELRLLAPVAVASKQDIDAVRKQLEVDFGLKFIPREPRKELRGFSSNPNGTHPFAGSGGGGTGFSSDMTGGGGFTSYGGGPGAMGSGKVWDPKDKKNLPMGAKRKS